MKNVLIPTATLPVAQAHDNADHEEPDLEEGLSLQAFLLANGNLHHECICGVTNDHQLVKCEPVSPLACLRGHDLDLRLMLGWRIGEENLFKSGQSRKSPTSR